MWLKKVFGCFNRSQDTPRVPQKDRNTLAAFQVKTEMQTLQQTNPWCFALNNRIWIETDDDDSSSISLEENRNNIEDLFPQSRRQTYKEQRITRTRPSIHRRSSRVAISRHTKHEHKEDEIFQESNERPYLSQIPRLRVPSLHHFQHVQNFHRLEPEEQEYEYAEYEQEQEQEQDQEQEHGESGREREREREDFFSSSTISQGIPYRSTDSLIVHNSMSTIDDPSFSPYSDRLSIHNRFASPHDPLDRVRSLFVNSSSPQPTSPRWETSTSYGLSSPSDFNSNDLDFNSTFTDAIFRRLESLQRRIEQLPTRRINIEKYNETTYCVICIDEYKNHDEVRTLPCFHCFHVHCIDKWLRSTQKCPICKTSINAKLRLRLQDMIP